MSHILPSPKRRPDSALATVSKIGEKPYTHGAEQRARILVTLAPDLPPDLMPNALAAVQDIWAPHARHVVLVALLPYLPPDLVSSALAMIQEIQATEPNPDALVEIIPHLEPDLLPQVLTAVRQIPHDYGRRRVLVALAPYLPMDLLPDALAAALSIGSEPFRARVLAVLTSHLPPDLLPKTLAAAQEIQSLYWRYRVLVALALRLPMDQRLEILTGALAAVLRMASDAVNPAAAFSRVVWFGVGDDPDEPPMPRTEGFAALTPLWASLPIDQAYSPWPSTLRACAMDSRADLIVDLHALTPVIAALGGTAAVAETFRALQDVGRWWP